MEVVQVSKNFLKYEQVSDDKNKRRSLNNLHFKEQIWPLKDNWVFVSLDEVIEKYADRLDAAAKLSLGLLEAKPKEVAYQQDGANLEKRFATGTDSEAVATAIFKVPFNDAIGNSYEFGDLDIAESFGIKSSSYGNCAMVEREPTGPQLIMIKDFRPYKYVQKGFYFCGIATVAMQLKYETIHRLTQTDAYFKKRSKAKTGFYGYKKLIPVKREDLTLPAMRELLLKYENPCWCKWLN